MGLKENYKDSFKKGLLYLWYSGANAQQRYIEIEQQPLSDNLHKKLEYISNNLQFVIGQLYKIEELVGKKEFEKIFEESYKYKGFPGLLQALKKFKSLYDDPYMREKYEK